MLGFHTFLPFYNVLPSKLVLAGNDTAWIFWNGKTISLFQEGNIPGFSEYSQFVAIDNNNTIWVGHPYRGVYKIDLRPGNPLSFVCIRKIRVFLLR